MSELFPVFVGITGKREFSDSAQTAKELEEKVRRRLLKIFDYIERRLPETPKILLTGAAAGADLIAAEELLFPKLVRETHKGTWLVVAVLPFEKSLFQQDFKPSEWERFQRVISDPRTVVWELPALRSGMNGKALRQDELARGPDKNQFQKDARRRHYEQVGLWIADQANILIGIMPAQERADKIGGTARIVAYRRGGWPDPVAEEVIAASEVLAPRRELHRPPKGYVWLIDPANDPLLANPPVTVLPPTIDGAEEQQTYKLPGLLQTEGPEALHQAQLLKASQKLFKIASEYADRNRIETREARWEHFECADPNPAQILDGISRELEPHAPAELYRRFIYMQIGGFLLAVLAFEIFAKYMHDKPGALAVYLIILIVIMALYSYAEWRELQPTAEDRRAVREALRVQSAWWRAGLNDRVDHFYLEGADDDLASVREATRNAVTWAQLKCRNQNTADWNAVFAPQRWPEFSRSLSASQYPRDWIGNQLFYFRQRKEQRKAKAALFETMGWVLFATAAGLSILLFFWFLLVESNHALNDAIHGWLNKMKNVIPAAVTIACVAGASLSWWTSERLVHRTRVKWRRSFTLGVGGLLAAMFLFGGLQVAATVIEQEEVRWALFLWLIPALAFAPYFMRKLLPVSEFLPTWFVLDTNQPHPGVVALGLSGAILFGFALQTFPLMMNEAASKHAAVYMTIIYIIFLPALGATMRFLSEKMALEAEALSYRDAFCWYAHAAQLLLELIPGQGNGLVDDRPRDIVRRLGKLALKENEAWLKSRRQRPLSPLM